MQRSPTLHPKWHHGITNLTVTPTSTPPDVAVTDRRFHCHPRPIHLPPDMVAAEMEPAVVWFQQRRRSEDVLWRRARVLRTVGHWGYGVASGAPRVPAVVPTARQLFPRRSLRVAASRLPPLSSEYQII